MPSTPPPEAPPPSRAQRAIPARAPRGKWRKRAWVALGIGLVGVGVVGGILPIVPGSPIVLLGVGVMATHSPRGRWLRWRVGAVLRARGLGHLTSPLKAFAHLSARRRGGGAPERPRSRAAVAPRPGA